MAYVMGKDGKVKRVSPPTVYSPPEGSEEMKKKVRKLMEEARKNPPKVIPFEELLEKAGSLEALFKKDGDKTND